MNRWFHQAHHLMSLPMKRVVVFCVHERKVLYDEVPQEKGCMEAHIQAI